jgi:hypothetical protein
MVRAAGCKLGAYFWQGSGRMRPRISEFSYGFALTRELIDKKWNGLQLTAAPFLPSLPAEGRPGGGFDVSLKSLNALVFLQFKVSHYMTRATAKGVSNGKLGVPYYRFDLHAPRSSDQHRLLVALEQQPGLPPRIVRYVAPAFYTEGEFDAAYFANVVSDRSVFIAPSQINLPDDREHSVGFVSPTDQGVVLSEPREIEGAIDYGAFRQRVENATSTSDRISTTVPEIQILRDILLQLALEIEPEATPERLFGNVTWVDRERVPHAATLPRLDEASTRRMRPLDAIGHVAWTQLSSQAIALVANNS